VALAWPFLPRVAERSDGDNMIFAAFQSAMMSSKSETYDLQSAIDNRKSKTPYLTPFSALGYSSSPRLDN
jgi:hypothetical protein